MATATRDGHTAQDQKTITDLSHALVKGALPGELDGFDEGARAEAAAFVAEAAAERSPGKPSIRLESVGHGRRFMRLAIVNDDMPFLVDSVAATVSSHELSIDRVLHPVVSVRRDENGRLTGVLSDDSSARRESMIYMEVERADAKVRRTLCDDIEDALADVRAAVEDWPMMQRALKADADRMPDGEGAALLRWFLDAHFTQLGHENRDRKNGKTDALGISRAGTREYFLAASSRTSGQGASTACRASEFVASKSTNDAIFSTDCQAASALRLESTCSSAGSIPVTRFSRISVSQRGSNFFHPPA